MDATQQLATRGVIGRPRDFLVRWLDFQSAGSILVLIVLTVLVIIPLLIMLLASVRPAGVMPFASSVFTFQGYAQAYGGSDLLPIIRNTLIYAGLGVVFALPIAFGFAFLTERTDMPLRNAMYVLMFIPMSTPVFATALGWVLLLGPRGGTINVYLRAMTGSDAAEGPFNIYSLPGLIFVHVLGMVPTMWLFLTAVLRRMDPVLEEAASAAGAGRWRTLRTITAPLMRPGVAAVAIYFFLSGLESLELPLALGPTAGIEVLATKIFFSLAPTADLGVNYGIPAAFGLLGLLMGVAGTFLYHHLVRRASDFAVVTGKGYRPRIIELGRWKYLALGAIGLFVIIKVVLPFAVLLYASFLRFYVPPIAEYLPDIKWTLIHYERLFDYRFFGRFFVNTLIVAVAGGDVDHAAGEFHRLAGGAPSVAFEQGDQSSRLHAAGDSRGDLDLGVVSDVRRHAVAWHLGADHAGVPGALPGFRHPSDALSGFTDSPRAGRSIPHQRRWKFSNLLADYAALALSRLHERLAMGARARGERLLGGLDVGVGRQRRCGQCHLRVLCRRTLQFLRGDAGGFDRIQFVIRHRRAEVDRRDPGAIAPIWSVQTVQAAFKKFKSFAL